jgi:hypothetical protein
LRVAAKVGLVQVELLPGLPLLLGVGVDFGRSVVLLRIGFGRAT